ncbi:bridging integrator 3 isoform X1 [Rhincodon typus]|uniref:bridging integrator 3 isoform X1 n=1 Tax=Rhincodon typus TaxID=259920 RepID=UPI00202F46EA|nr:bridging integrator 3 isoform X1 [Rhincodon typus]
MWKAHLRLPADREGRQCSHYIQKHICVFMAKEKIEQRAIKQAQTLRSRTRCNRNEDCLLPFHSEPGTLLERAVTLPEMTNLLKSMSKSAVKISSDLLTNPLCEQDQMFMETVTALDTAMRRMDAFNQEKVNQIQKTAIEPLKKFSNVFPSLNMAVKRREQTLQDYKRLQSKVEKYEEKEKSGPVLVKLHQAKEELRPVREDFEAKNKQLLEEMPKFYNSRIDYFQPSFEALIRAQVMYYTEMSKIFGDLTGQIQQQGMTDEQREKENEAKLNDLRALSIVADD